MNFVLGHAISLSVDLLYHRCHLASRETLSLILVFSRLTSYKVRGVGKGGWWGVLCSVQDTLGPAYNEFGYNEHQATKNRFLCISIIDCNVKNNEHPLMNCSFFCIFLLVVSGTLCKSNCI